MLNLAIRPHAAGGIESYFIQPDQAYSGLNAKSSVYIVSLTSVLASKTYSFLITSTVLSS